MLEGVGIVDRRLRQMLELGLLLEESKQLVLRRLRHNFIGFGGTARMGLLAVRAA